MEKQLQSTRICSEDTVISLPPGDDRLLRDTLKIQSLVDKGNWVGDNKVRAECACNHLCGDLEDIIKAGKSNLAAKKQNKGNEYSRPSDWERWRKDIKMLHPLLSLGNWEDPEHKYLAEYICDRALEDLERRIQDSEPNPAATSDAAATTTQQNVSKKRPHNNPTEGKKSKKQQPERRRIRTKIGGAGDSLKWRKYGVKKIKELSYGREYFRCACEECVFRRCPVTKHVQQVDDKNRESIYYGDHSCGVCTHPNPPEVHPHIASASNVRLGNGTQDSERATENSIYYGSVCTHPNPPAVHPHIASASNARLGNGTQDSERATENNSPVRRQQSPQWFVASPTGIVMQNVDSQRLHHFSYARRGLQEQQHTDWLYQKENQHYSLSIQTQEQQPHAGWSGNDSLPEPMIGFGGLLA